eukprot:4856050-Prymnesium_polylepis.1
MAVTGASCVRGGGHGEDSGGKGGGGWWQGWRPPARLSRCGDDHLLHVYTCTWPTMADGRCCGRWPMLSPKA